MGPRRPERAGSRGATARGEVALPRVSLPLLAFFTRYAKGYLRRHLHSLRVAPREWVGTKSDAGAARLQRELGDEPLIVVTNHPSWWDPLTLLFLARTLFPARRHFAPIDAEALDRYRIFSRLGFFGVERSGAAGTRRFLALAGELLARPATTLWITAQGRFADPRERPVELASGVGALAGRLTAGAILPLALEYPFWEERTPEALVRFGEPLPLPLPPAAGRRGRQRAAFVAARLEATQDALAGDAVGRREEAFAVLLAGRAGVGGVYDLGRRLRARLTGRRFRPEHGGEPSRMERLR